MKKKLKKSRKEKIPVKPGEKAFSKKISGSLPDDMENKQQGLHNSRLRKPDRKGSSSNLKNPDTPELLKKKSKPSGEESRKSKRLKPSSPKTGSLSPALSSSAPLESIGKNLPPETKRYLIYRFWKDFIQKYWKKLLITLFLSALVAATAAAYAFLVSHIVNHLKALGDDTQTSVLKKTIEFIFSSAAFIFLTSLIRAIAMYLQTLSANSIALSIVRDIQMKMFTHLLKADYVRFQIENTGNLVSRFMNDVNFVSQALLRSINNLARDSLTLFGLLCTMLYYDWMLTLILLVVYPIAFFPIIKISQKLRRQSAQTQRYLGDITAFLTESFKGARLVRSYRLEEYEEKRANKAFEERRSRFLKLVSLHAGVDPILEVLSGIAIAGILVFGVWRTGTGVTSYGSFAAILTALIMAAGSVRALGTLNNVVQEGLAALSRIFTLLEEQPKITDKPDAKVTKIHQGHIHFKKVGFSYTEEGEPVLKDLTLEVRPRAITALVGASGAGKTTLINLIPRLYEVSSGQILIDGQNIQNMTLASLRDHLALVSQDVALFNDQILTNIGFGRIGAQKSEIELAAQAAAAHDFIMEIPEGYSAGVGESGERLSGGQKQRIALARAILRASPILLLDEATSALDAESEFHIQTELKKFAKNKTVLVIAHRLSTVKAADWIYVLDQGQIVEQGNHESLLHKKGLYARLCKLQFSEDKER